MVNCQDKNKLRKHRHLRSRKRIQGTADKPRLAVFRSLKNISVQAIDDVRGMTLASASSMEKDFSSKGQNGGNIRGAKLVGELIGQRLKGLSVDTVIFDRSGYQFHGRVAAVAEGAKEKGLVF